MFFCNLRNIAIPCFLLFVCSQLLFFPPKIQGVSLSEQTVIGRFDNQLYGLPEELGEVSDDARIEIGGEKISRGEFEAMANTARMCHQFFTSLASDVKVLSVSDRDSADPRISVRDFSEDINTLRRKQGKLKELLGQACKAGTNSLFTKKIYPNLYLDLKQQGSANLKAAVERFKSGGAETASGEQKEAGPSKMSLLAKRYRTVLTSDDHQFLIGAAMGDTRAVGKTYMHDGIITVKRKGYYEVLGVPPILVQGGGALDRYNIGDRVVILIRITGSRRWQFFSGDIGHVYTANLIKIVPH